MSAGRRGTHTIPMTEGGQTMRGSVKALAVILLTALLAGAALAETDQGILAGVYKTDGLGFSVGSIREDGGKWMDCVFDENSYLSNQTKPRFVFENGEEIRMYANGFMLVRAADGESMSLVRAEDGKEVFSAASLGVTGIAAPAGAGELLAEGLVMVYSLEESLNGVKYAFGVLDTAGEWVLPLSSEHPLLTCGLEVSSETFTQEHTLRYAGEGRFIVQDYGAPFRYRLYDMTENAVYDPAPATEDKDISGIMKRNIEADGWKRFRNGQCAYRSPIGKYLFTMDARGVIHDEIVLDKAWLPSESFERYEGQRAPDGRCVIPVYCKGGTYLVYSDGQTLELGTFRPVDMIVYDGFWMMTGRNKEDTVFYFAVDTAGSFLFDPVRTEAVELLMEDGQVLECTDHPLEQYGEKALIAFDGRILYTSSAPERTMGLNKGVLLEYVDNKASADEPLLYVDLRELPGM